MDVRMELKRPSPSMEHPKKSGQITTDVFSILGQFFSRFLKKP
jgi:hypothetical protein